MIGFGAVTSLMPFLDLLVNAWYSHNLAWLNSPYVNHS